MSAAGKEVRRTLATSFSGRDNAFNFMRLVFATAVIVGHARILGYGVPGAPLGLPVDLGGLSVSGFFALSGFLITRSGRRTSFLRYWWHRILRIFPGYWVCLLVTAAVISPILWWRLHGGLAGYLGARPSPLGYLVNNWSTDVEQPFIGDTLRGAHIADINGSLWTLKYELACYVLISLLALVGLLRRARVVVPVLAVAGLAVIGYDFVHDPVHTGPLAAAGHWFAVPLAGHYLTLYVVIYTTAFLLGASAEMFKEYVPVNDLLGGLSLVLVVAAMVAGLPILGPALLAYVYLLLWAGIRLPAVLRRVGRRNDYSYGVYIYAFIVQQVLALAGVTRFGLAVYLGLSLLCTYAVAMLSWHLIEKQALKLKDWTPAPIANRWRAYRTRKSGGQSPPVVDAKRHFGGAGVGPDQGRPVAADDDDDGNQDGNAHDNDDLVASGPHIYPTPGGPEWLRRDLALEHTAAVTERPLADLGEMSRSANDSGAGPKVRPQETAPPADIG